ncbi:MAG: YdeI/OmpD-associated family protein [Ferruginibacter sp.]
MQKFPGKGGWTYAMIPEIKQDKNAAFGWVSVSGSIDDLPVKNFRLIPMGNGKLFFPVKAALRKQLNKKEGDCIHIILYAQESPAYIPSEFKDCLADEPIAEKNFYTLGAPEQQAWINWIYEAKKEETKTERMVKAIDMIGRKEKIHQK